MSKQDMWVDTRNCVPLMDGTYMVQTAAGDIMPMLYTYEGGWNTSYEKDGTLRTVNKISDGYVVRWLDVPKPDAVPQEWKQAWLNS